MCVPYILLYLRCQKTMEIKVPAQAGDTVLAGCSILRYEIFLGYLPYSFTPGKLEWRLEAADTPTVACLFHIHLYVSSKKQDYWMIWTNDDFLRLPWTKHSIKTINNNVTFIPPFDLELLNSTWRDFKNTSNVSTKIVFSGGCILALNLIYYYGTLQWKTFIFCLLLVTHNYFPKCILRRIKNTELNQHQCRHDVAFQNYILSLARKKFSESNEKFHYPQGYHFPILLKN